MKTVFNRDQVAHVWAAGSQSTGRTSNGSLFFDGAKLYSYGAHFTVAERLTRANSEQVLFVITDATYSSTTARHISAAWQSVRGMPHAVTVSVPEIARLPIDTAENAISEAGASYARASNRKRDSYARRNMIASADSWAAAAGAIAAYILHSPASDKNSAKRARAIIKTIDNMPCGYQERAAYLGKAKAKADAAAYIERAKAAQSRGGSDARSHYQALNDARMLYVRAGEVLKAVGEKAPRVPAQLKKAIEQALPAYHSWHVGDALEKARCNISYWRRGDNHMAVSIDSHFANAKEHGWAGNALSDYFHKLALKDFGAKRYHAACSNVRRLRESVQTLPFTTARQPEQHEKLLRMARNYSAQSGEYPTLQRQALDIIASLEAMQPVMDAIRADAEKHKAFELQRWRMFDTMRINDEITRLRVRNDTVHTSRGAEVSRRAALIAWEIVKSARGGNADAVTKRYHGRSIGPFRFHSVNSNGDIQIGCHSLVYSELAYAAQCLELK